MQISHGDLRTLQNVFYFETKGFIFGRQGEKNRSKQTNKQKLAGPEIIMMIFQFCIFLSGVKIKDYERTTAAADRKFTLTTFWL